MYLETTFIIAIASILFVVFLILLVLLFSKTRDVGISHEKDDYIAMLVHDIRSPLNVIKGSADILSKESKNLTSEDTSKLLTQIIDTSNVLLDMVSDILDVSKMESGKFEINKASSDLNLLLKMFLNQKGI